VSLLSTPTGEQNVGLAPTGRSRFVCRSRRKSSRGSPGRAKGLFEGHGVNRAVSGQGLGFKGKFRLGPGSRLLSSDVSHCVESTGDFRPKHVSRPIEARSRIRDFATSHWLRTGHRRSHSVEIAGGLRIDCARWGWHKCLEKDRSAL